MSMGYCPMAEFRCHPYSAYPVRRQSPRGPVARDSLTQPTGCYIIATNELLITNGLSWAFLIASSGPCSSPTRLGALKEHLDRVPEYGHETKGDTTMKIRPI